MCGDCSPKGQTLLAGQPWTDELDFANSITLRTERVFVDTSKPWAVRLEQIYSSTLAVDHSLTAHASLLKPRPGARGAGRGANAAPPEVAKDFGSFDDVSRDLRESPYLMELDLGSVADGTYQVRVEVKRTAKKTIEHFEFAGDRGRRGWMIRWRRSRAERKGCRNRCAPMLFISLISCTT